MEDKKNLAHTRISRRQMLKLMGMGTAGAMLAACAPKATPTPETLADPTGKPVVEATAEPVVEATVEVAPAAEPVTIKTMWSPGNMDVYLRDCIEAYREINPNVEFDINVIEVEQKRATELTIMTSPGAPDFAYINFGSGLTDKLAQAGAISPLDDYYEQYGWWDQLPDHLHTHEYDGHMYHFSVASVTTPLMWYNKSLMSELGLEAPTSLEELYTWADVCRENGVEPLAMGDRNGWPGFHMYQCIATRTTPLEDYEKILNFDEEEYFMADYPGFEEAFQIMRDMETKGVWAKGVLDMDDAAAQGLFLNGEALAYETGVWAISVMREGLGEDLDFFLFPQVKADIPTPLTASYADEFMLSEYSEVKDEVAAFFDFVLSKDGQRIVAQVGSMPISTEITAADMEGFADPMTGKAAELFGCGDYPVTDEIVTFWPAELYALLRDNGQAVIDGQKTPAEVVAEFDELAAKFRAGEA